MFFSNVFFAHCLQRAFRMPLAWRSNDLQGPGDDGHFPAREKRNGVRKWSARGERSHERKGRGIWKETALVREHHRYCVGATYFRSDCISGANKCNLFSQEIGKAQKRDHRSIVFDIISHYSRLLYFKYVTSIIIFFESVNVTSYISHCEPTPAFADFRLPSSIITMNLLCLSWGKSRSILLPLRQTILIK